jgi:hypothetical protein
MNAKALVQSLRVHVTRAAVTPNRLTPVSGTYLVKSIVTATVIAVTITVLGMGQGLAQARPQTIRMKALSANDQARYTQILRGVIQNPQYLTPAVHGEFQRILSKTGATAAQIKVLRERMTGMLTVYYPLFWQDALASLRNGRPIKSAQRQNYEKKMLAQRLITKEAIAANDSRISMIAQRKPITNQGKSVVLNEQAIQASLSNVQQTARRINQLFAPRPR